MWEGESEGGERGGEGVKRVREGGGEGGRK